MHSGLFEVCLLLFAELDSKTSIAELAAEIAAPAKTLNDFIQLSKGDTVFESTVFVLIGTP